MSLLTTRGHDRASESQAILRGIAPNGGLYLPERFPFFSLSQIAALAPLDYAQRASQIIGALLPDFPREDVESAVHQAYAQDRFDHPAIAPVTRLSREDFMLELYHGPTLAFKDMALQLLPRLMTLSMAHCGETREVLILVATSGDTGKAALEGFADVPGTRCAVFYPQDGVSTAQRLQMVTQTGANTHVLAVDGNFDDAQTSVKRLFTDEAFIQDRLQAGYVLSSANSINYGRLIPQVAYYFSAYADLLANGTLSLGDPVHFVVPTGNFGNILAADYARRMGLPIGKLLCASNSNRVLADFMATGSYDIQRPFLKTISPSMDILISSNLERYLYELSLRDPAQVRNWMEDLRSKGAYTLPATALASLQTRMTGAWADDDRSRAAIRTTWAQHQTLIDPHTAVAAAVLEDYRAASGDKTPAVIVATASPYKFGRDVALALNPDLDPNLDEFSCCKQLHTQTKVPIPAQILALPTLPIRHDQRCAPAQMGDALKAILP